MEQTLSYFCRVVEHSISPDGIAIASIHARFPRMVHSELLTHRVLSRNGRSSRAVPYSVLIREEIYTPDFYINKPGMQAGERMTGWKRVLAHVVWNMTARMNKVSATALGKLGVHKQWTNRQLEWFGWIDVLITSTEWENFFELRCHKDAQPEIRFIANMMREELNKSIPKKLKIGEWHLPYVTEEEKSIHPLDIQKKLSVARCARISYVPFDGNASVERELMRYNLLITSKPAHFSPTEAQATPAIEAGYNGNFHPSWTQLRKLLEVS